MAADPAPHAPSCANAADLLLRWPAREPLAALVSGGGAAAHNAWTILARPSEALVFPAHATREQSIAALEEAFARTPRLAALERARAPRAGGELPRKRGGQPPFTGGWIVALGYSLGTLFEPTAQSPSRHRTPTAPRAVLYWCEDAWCYEHATDTLHAVGNPPALNDAAHSAPHHWHLGSVVDDDSDARYAAAVARTVEYIHAGDAFQANIARRFHGLLAGDVRSFAHAAISRNAAWFGAAIDLPDGGAIVSMSPELFLRVRPDGTAVSRPIKGTRPAHTPRAELAKSAKDAAELAMIVDLMRNDLGRVAEFGSVSVAEDRVLETHTTVHHGVAEVRATLRDDVEWTDLLAATFPPGSVTGAPKVRAMQIIDELEDHERGFYCGAIGFVSKSGDCGMSVAIRTAQIGPETRGTGDAPAVRTVVYHAGCGVVSDSEPMEEVAETHAKALALTRLESEAPTGPSAAAERNSPNP
jgi:anthranilate/para-aminobenzoate synthase component I